MAIKDFTIYHLFPFYTHFMFGRRYEKIMTSLSVWEPGMYVFCKKIFNNSHVYVSFQSSGETSPASLTPAGTPALGTHAPKYGTVIPNRIFVGGIAANVSNLKF